MPGDNRSWFRIPFSNSSVNAAPERAASPAPPQPAHTSRWHRFKTWALTPVPLGDEESSPLLTTPLRPDGSKQCSCRKAVAALSFLVVVAVFMLLAYYCCWFVVLSGAPRSWGWYCGVPEGHGRLRIINGCPTEPLWIANQGYKTAFLAPQMKKLRPFQSVMYDIPKEGLASTRFWPLAGCDDHGSCTVGQSVGSTSGLPPCDSVGCGPPVDSKFEATWGCHADSDAQCGMTPQGYTLRGPDHFDVSLVDGFTLPYRVEFSEGCRPPRRTDGSLVEMFDASRLDYNTMCPSQENIASSPSTPGDLPLADLHIHHPSQGGKVVGCASPCTRLSIPNWQNPPYRYPPGGEWAKYYCCPAGSLGEGQETVQKCMAGPVNHTKYVTAIHNYAPDVYAYAYDDGQGNFACESNSTYTLTFFCPPK